MPITINGSGTIGGLSAGGLPANSVTAATIGSLPAGSVLQVVSGETTTEASITSASTYADTGLSASITPSSASNKVLIYVCQHYQMQRDTKTQGMYLKLLRGSTQIQSVGSEEMDAFIKAEDVDGDEKCCLANMHMRMYLDSPNTTSATTYKTQAIIMDTGSNGLLKFQKDSQKTSTMILMEVAA